MRNFDYQPSQKQGESFRNLEIIPVTAQIWTENPALEWENSDPADRTVAATAKMAGIPIMTCDKLITDFYSDTIWQAIAEMV